MKIISDKQVHEFLFKYATIILAFGISTVIGAINTLAPLEDSVYRRYYEARAEIELLNSETQNPNISGEIKKFSADRDLQTKVYAKLASAEHSKEMISSFAKMNMGIFECCKILFFVLTILAICHWFAYKLNEADRQ